jgi:hypothetical protein
VHIALAWKSMSGPSLISRSGHSDKFYKIKIHRDLEGEKMSQEVKDVSVTEFPKAARVPWPLVTVSLILMVSLGVAWNT